MNAFLVRGLYVNFHSDSLKVFAFVDAHGVWVYEDTMDAFLYFTEISCYYYCPLVALNVTVPDTQNIDSMD